jgi:hypothetical protein
MSTEERAERIAMADIRARAQAEYAINEALRQRQTSRLDEESSSQIELMTIGKSVQAATAMRYEFQQLTEAKNAAYQETGKYIVLPDEVKAIRNAADAMGELAKKSAEAKIQDDLRFQNEQLYRNAMDREVAAQLHGAGLSQDDPVGIDIRRNLELQRRSATWTSGAMRQRRFSTICCRARTLFRTSASCFSTWARRK